MRKVPAVSAPRYQVTLKASARLRAVSVASFFWRDRISPKTAPRPASARQQGGFDWAALFNFSALVREIRPEYRRTFFVLVITTFVMMMYRMFIQAMLPLYAGTHLQLSPSQIGYLFSMMGIVVFVMIIPAGLVIDKLGRKVNYWLYDRHPGEILQMPMAFFSKPVPASEIILFGEKQRPGQLRFMPRLAASMMRLRDFDADLDSIARRNDSIHAIAEK